jgi:hypothetical protein
MPRRRARDPNLHIYRASVVIVRLQFEGGLDATHGHARGDFLLPRRGSLLGIMDKDDFAQRCTERLRLAAGFVVVRTYSAVKLRRDEAVMCDSYCGSHTLYTGPSCRLGCGRPNRADAYAYAGKRLSTLASPVVSLAPATTAARSRRMSHTSV